MFAVFCPLYMFKSLLTLSIDVITAEAIALQRGLELLEDLGCQSVIVESDSLEIIQACNGVNEIYSA